MKTSPPAKRPNPRMFGVRLSDDLVEALHRRAERDRRTIRITAEIVVAAGLEALERQESRRGRRTA